MDRIFSKQETVRYVIVGFSGVLLDYGIYSLLLYAGVLTGKFLDMLHFM